MNDDQLFEYLVAMGQMTPEEAEKARKKSWIQILIGMPLFIGFIYLIFLLIRLMK